MALPGKTDIKVTATDALEFEPVAPVPRKRRWGLKLFLLLVLAALGSWGWLIYGHEIRAVLAGGEPGVPLIKAAMGPVKVRPENPGGLEVPDRDKLVYDRIGGRPEGEGEARGPERLLPPPEQPLPKPGPAAALAPAAPAAEPATEPAPEPATEPVRAPAKRKPTAKTKPVPKVPTVKDVKTAERPLPPPPPLAPPTSNPTPSPVLSAARSTTKSADERTPPAAPANAKLAKSQATAPTAAATETSRTKTGPTKTGPTGTAPTETARAAPAPKPATPNAVPGPTPVPTGRSFLVQLAAARSPQGARDEWDRLKTKHQDLLGSLGLRVTKADLGPTRGVFYRLRAGPLSDEAAARELCQQLAKRQVGCLIIKPQP